MSNCCPKVECLETRVAFSVNAGLDLSGVYLNPTLLTTAFVPAPVHGGQDLYALDQRYGLSAQVIDDLEWQNYHWGWGSLNEKWVRGDDGSWFYLLPQGDLYRWQTGAYPLHGTLIARLWDTPMDSATANRLHDLDQQFGFVATGNYYQDWGGMDEKWIGGADGYWYYILPAGQIYRWHVGTYPVQGTLVADLQVEGVDAHAMDASVFRFPTFLTEADNSVPVESSADPYALDQQYRFYTTDNLYQNWGGKNEKWIKDRNHDWYYVLPHGALYRWDLAMTGALHGELIALLDPSVHENPLALTRAVAPVAELPAQVRLLTDLNRTHTSDDTTIGQSGGFSPHARGLMRASDGSLWFATDDALSRSVNKGTRYFRQDPISREWHLMGETEFIGPVSESATSLMKDDVIYSYALGVNSSVIHESYFSTVDASQRGSHIIYNGENAAFPGAAYVGSAVSPAGHRAVWWTEYPDLGEGAFVYLYDTGGGWRGPVASPLNGHQRFAYLYAQFVDDTRLILAGELYDFRLPVGMIFQAEMAELEIGQPLSLVAGLYSSTGENMRSISDLWVDPATGDVHVLAESNSATFGDDYTNTLQPRALLYYYKPGNASWTGNNFETSRFDNTFRGRFLVSPTELHLIRAHTSGGGIRVRTVARADISGAIDWHDVPEMQLGQLPLGFVMADGIWTESSFLQTEPVQGTSFVFTGHWPTQDKYLWHVELQ